MNQAIRRVWLAVVALLIVVLGATTYIQFFAADALNNNALNTSRKLDAANAQPRGAIIVGGTPIAESKKNADESTYSYRRVYKDSELYSGLTGYYSLDAGLTQLEASQNTVLTGSSDTQFFDRLANLFTGQANLGANVELTIDKKIQQAAYDALPDGKKGSITVLNPKTGEVLAMVSKPSFDANMLSVQNTAQLRANRAELNNVKNLAINWNPAVYDRVSPGSSFKILDLVAGLESGYFKVDGEYENPTKWTPPGTSKAIGNFDHGNCAAKPNKAPLSFIVAQSCNTPFTMGVQEIGADKMKEVTERFGFNSKPDWLGLAPTSSSIWPEDMNASELSYASIGQFDVQATTLQMAMVAAGIANDGSLMKPQLVKQITAQNLQVLQGFKPEKLRDVTTAKVANEVTDLMRGPVKSGTATHAQIPGLDIAAKTGTAQIGNDGMRVHAWIAGFAPADDPTIAIAVNVQDISYDESRNLTSEIMKKVMKAVFNK